MGTITFKFKIKLVNGMRVKTFRINETVLSSETLDDLVSGDGPNVVEGELSIIAISDTVTVSVSGVGSPYLAGSFNITYNEKNLFSADEKLLVKSNARFRFYKEKVKIPF